MDPTPKPMEFTPESGWADPNFHRNQSKIPPAELEPYYGKHVACTWDGTRILAGAETLGALFEELKRLGIDSQTVAFDYIDEPGATYL